MIGIQGPPVTDQLCEAGKGLISPSSVSAQPKTNDKVEENNKWSEEGDEASTSSVPGNVPPSPAISLLVGKLLQGAEQHYPLVGYRCFKISQIVRCSGNK